MLHSYWGTAYAANYARLSALVDAVQTQVLYYEDAPAGTSYFAMSNGRTEASENVWGTALPYLVPVDSSTDTAADNYEYTLNLSAAQLQQLLAERLGIAADVAEAEALADVQKEFEQGFQGWEYKFNTVASSRGDYPFITVTAFDI